MRAQVIFLFFCLLGLGACTGNDPALPTYMPTAVPELITTPTTPLPPTNTPITNELATMPATPQPLTSTPIMTNDEADVDAVLQEIDQEVCQEVLTTQAELVALQEQGQDVAELVTAVAELVDELADCESLLTPTPFN